MDYSSPEKMGIKSSNIEAFVRILEEKRLSTHSLIIMRNGNIIFEKYWAPFHKEFQHRMYSVTKSFVALAIGFLEQDGLVDLDAPMIKYFPDELENQPDENLRNQTVRDMLKMSTAKPGEDWFTARCEDRVRFYFENKRYESRPSGTIFEYDSTGSFVLGALVERLTGKELLEYLREKALDEIGFSKDACILKCPGGHSWGDSALICRADDLLKTAMWVMNKGEWNGKQLLNKEYIEKAVSKQISNTALGLDEYNTQGYGYQFWRTFDNSFFFNGMGDQLGVCVPDKDIIMVINSDNQGYAASRKIIMDSFFDEVVRKAVDGELPENVEAQSSLENYTKDLKLQAAIGEKYNNWQDKVNGVTYVLNKNPMGISKMKLCFEGNKGTLYYTNEQGDKELPFGMCYNEFAPFPQEGYSDEVGSQKGDRLYDCAASAAWVGENQLFIKVQIIDTYFGRLNINLGFKDGQIGVHMNKTAEDFLNEYQGNASGKAEK
ncbi:MAG: serine hydrolase [Ruminococcaceae bacterium]|nr:serine hydrolase [Oscillospiraceae bacterium]